VRAHRHSQKLLRLLTLSSALPLPFYAAYAFGLTLLQLVTGAPSPRQLVHQAQAALEKASLTCDVSDPDTGGGLQSVLCSTLESLQRQPAPKYA
jgi:hypothetical protein